jgi:Peptidase family M48
MAFLFDLDEIEYDEQQRPTTPRTPPAPRVTEFRLEDIDTELEPGNIDLRQQPRVPNPVVGGTSTVYSRSYRLDGLETLLPSVTPDGRFLQSDEEVIGEYQRTGRHLGKFSTPEAASSAARVLHQQYEAGQYTPIEFDLSEAEPVTEPTGPTSPTRPTRPPSGPPLAAAIGDPTRAYLAGVTPDVLPSRPLGAPPPEPPPDFRVEVVGKMPPPTARERVQDLAISAVKGAIGVPEFAVGMADIVSGGEAGRLLEAYVAFKPKEAKAILDTFTSEGQQAAWRRVQEAEGLMAKAEAALSNPSIIGHSVIESFPSMLGGAGVARGLLQVAPRVGPLIAGAIGESAVTMGAGAERVRQETGRLTPRQTEAVVTGGIFTGMLSVFGGKLAQKLGIADVETMLAAGAVSAGARAGLVRQIVEGAIQEGFLEELPQSVQEQVFQNQAEGRDPLTGVDDAAVMGFLTGAAMGAGAQVGQRFMPQPLPPTGRLVTPEAYVPLTAPPTRLEPRRPPPPPPPGAPPGVPPGAPPPITPPVEPPPAEPPPAEAPPVVPLTEPPPEAEPSPLAPTVAPAVPPEPSEQDISAAEARANRDRVAADPEAASTPDLLRAAGYLSHEREAIRHEAERGGRDRRDVIDSINREIAQYDQIVERRRTEEARPPAPVTPPPVAPTVPIEAVPPEAPPAAPPLPAKPKKGRPPFAPPAEDTRSRSIDEAPAVKDERVSREHAFLMRWLAEDLLALPFQPGARIRGKQAIDITEAAPSQEEARRRLYQPRVAGTPTQKMFEALGVTASRAEIARHIDRFLMGDAKKPTKTSEAAQKIVRVLEAAWDGQAFNFNRVSEDVLAEAGLPFDSLYAPGSMPDVETQPKDLVDRYFGRPAQAPEDVGVRARLELDDPERLTMLVQRYNARPNVGNVVSPDEAKELFAPYAESPMGRVTFNEAVTEPATRVADEVYQRRLAEPPGFPGRVVITSGGPGSGKTTIGTQTETARSADIVYDSTEADPADAEAHIVQALDSGRDVARVYVYRDPVDAWLEGVLPRADETGRPVSIEEHVLSHGDALRTAVDLGARYADNPRVSFEVIDNTRPDKPTLSGTEARAFLEAKANAYNAESVRTAVQELTESARRAGLIPDPLYAAYTRVRPAARPRVRRGVEEGRAAERERPQVPEVPPAPTAEAPEPGTLDAILAKFFPNFPPELWEFTVDRIVQRPAPEAGPFGVGVRIEFTPSGMLVVSSTGPKKDKQSTRAVRERFERILKAHPNLRALLRERAAAPAPPAVPTPPVTDILETGEAQPRLPEAGAARQVGRAEVTLKAPVQATAEDFALTAVETPEARAAREEAERPVSLFDVPEDEQKPFDAKSLEDAFGLTDEQAAATVALAESMGLDVSRIVVVKGGVPGGGALPQSVLFQQTPPETEEASAAWYYDNILQALESWQPKGTPAQLVAHLAKTKGTKDEIEAIGLRPWLEGKTSVTKAEVQAFVNEHRITLEEKIGGVRGPSARQPSARQRAARADLEQRGYTVIAEPGDPEGVYLVQGGRIVLDADLSDDAYDALIALRETYATPTYYRQYILQGPSRNYREILLTLPAKPTPPPTLDWVRSVEQLWTGGSTGTQEVEVWTAKAGTGEYRIIKFTDVNGELQYALDSFDWDHSYRVAQFDSLDEAKHAAAGASLARPWRERIYTPPHFAGEPNLLLHVRTTDRTLPDGKSVLFIEEVQSDWHRQLRTLEKQRAVVDRLAAQMAKLTEDSPQWEAVRRRREAALTKLAQLDVIPRAPFGGGAWTTLALKRMLAYAVEHGYDSIAWTTGEQQQERYDLSKQVTQILWSPKRGRPAAAGRRVEVVLATGASFVMAVNNEGIVDAVDMTSMAARDLIDKSLDEVVGKDVANKILATSTGELSGEGLKIGGEWATALYDRQMVNLANDITKKYGGRVGQVTIPGIAQLPGEWAGLTAEPLEVVGEPGYDAIDWTIRLANGEWFGRFSQQRTAEAIFQTAQRMWEKRQRGAQVHHLVIPSALASDIKAKGLPLFQGPKASVEFLDDGKALIRALESPDVSSGIHELMHIARRWLLDRSIPEEQRAGITNKHIETAEKWAGVENGLWTAEAEEKFARGGERFLRNERAPADRSMRTIFAKIAAWLRDIYTEITGTPIDIDISPAMRRVYSRIMARGGPPTTKPPPRGPPPTARAEPRRAAEGVEPRRGAEGAAIGAFVQNVPVQTGTVPPVGPSLFLAPVAPVTPPVTVTRQVELPEIVDFARFLGRIPQVVKRFRKPGVLGQFREGQVRIHADLFTAGNEEQLAAALAHEIGHWVDWLPHHTLKRGNILGHLLSLRRFLRHSFTAPSGKTIELEVIRDELTALSDFWRPWDPAKASASYKAYRHSPAELYADAMSVLMNNPGLLQQKAPTFYEQFFEHLDRKPDVKTAYFEIQALLGGTREDLVKHRREGVREMFEEGDARAIEVERVRQRENALMNKDLWFRFRIQFIDKNTPIRDRVKQLIKRGMRIPEDQDPRYFLEERHYLGGLLKTFTETRLQPVYEALLKAKIDWHTFGEALFYQRIISGDYSEKANPRGLSPASVQELLDDLNKGLSPDQRTVLVAQAAEWRDAIRFVAEQAYDAGLYKDELYDAMRRNPAYATYRVIEYIEEDLTAKVHHAGGTLKDVQNVADATALKMLVTLRAIERQKMKIAVFKFLEQYFPSDIEQARQEFTGRGIVPLPPKDPKKQVLVYYYEKGRLRGKYIDPYVADSLNNASVGQNNAVITAIRWLNSHVFRPAFVTYNPGFQTFNIARDFYRFWKNTPDMTFERALFRYGQGIELARVRAFGLPSAPSPRQRRAFSDLLAAQHAKILTITFDDLMSGRDPEETQIEETLAKAGIGQYRTRPKHHPAVQAFVPMLDFIKNTGNFIETLPKAAGIYEFKGTGSIADISPAQRSFIRRKIGSPDFLSGGTYKPMSNEILLFSNAITQAMRGDFEVATDPQTRSGFWWKTVAVNVAPKLALFALLYLLPDDDEDAWWRDIRKNLRSISEYDMTNYLPIPLGLDDGNAIYIRFPQDDSGRLIGGLVWKLLQGLRGDKEAMQAAHQVLDYTAGQFPSLTPALTAPAAVTAFVSGKNIYEPFRNRFLFTEEEMAAGGWRKLKKFIGYEFQQIGGGLFWKFYPGEARPEEETRGQTILEAPILSNIVGRWIKISDYGRTEKLREAGAIVKGEEARARFAEKDAVNEALAEYRKLAPPKQTRSQQQRLANEIVKKLYPDAPMAKRLEERRDILKKIRMGLVRGKADQVVERVMSATSNAQKTAIIVAASKDMAEAEFDTWFSKAKREGVVSTEVAISTRRELKKGK